MANASPGSGTEAPSVATRHSKLLALLREPLLHLLVLGAALFGVSHIIVRHSDDPHTISVDSSVDLGARDVFRQEHGREPNAAELDSLRRGWLDEEVLYREGIAMQLDKGDPAIRARVIFKMRELIESGLGTPVFNEQTVRAWFEKNHAKYDRPPAYSFEEAEIASTASQDAARTLARRLNSGPAFGHQGPAIRMLKDQSLDSIVKDYGEDFVTSLETSPKNEWQVLNSKSGARVVRFDSLIPATPVTFEEVGGAVLQDWIDMTMAQKRDATVIAMEKRYTVKVKGPDSKRAANSAVTSGAN